MTYKVDCPHCGWVVRTPVKLHAPQMECPACGGAFEAIFTEDFAATSSDELPDTSNPRTVQRAEPKRFLESLWVQIIIAMVLVGGALIYANSYFDSQKRKAEEEKRQENYADLFKSTLSEIAVTSDCTSKVCAEHLRRWQSAVSSRYGDIDDAIRSSMDAQSELIVGIQKSQIVCETAMGILNSPPPKYIEAHKKLVSIYGTANQYFGLAISPNGNLGSYSEAVKSARDSLSKQFSELNVTMPK